jgi:RNA polymerase sigma-70 factor (ECF subfamily)
MRTSSDIADHKLTASEETELLDRCRAGELAAYDGLVLACQDRVFNLCWRMCGSRTDAEDFTQDTFVKAFESLGRFDGRARFYTWLFRIAANLVISARRKRSRACLVSIDATTEDTDGGGPRSLAEKLDSGEIGPDDRASEQERQSLVLAALATLDEEQRCIVTLRDLESLGYGEIADILNVPVGTVKSRLHRARLALREKLMPLLGNAERE